MSYHHFTAFEQGRIEAFHNLGYSNRRIAIKLGRHRSSSDREIRRNSANGKYQAKTAAALYKQRRGYSRPKGKWSREIAETIVKKLKITWSPEQIANSVTFGNISFKTRYNWLYQGKLDAPLSVLRRKGISRKPVDVRGKFTVGRTISQRPESVDRRETFGHWELDTVVSARGKSKGCFATFVERKTRLYAAIKIPDRSAHSMYKAISRLHKILPERSFLTATTDRENV